MPMLLAVLTALPWATFGYETWHLVDVAQVVCPAPTSSSLPFQEKRVRDIYIYVCIYILFVCTCTFYT